MEFSKKEEFKLKDVLKIIWYHIPFIIIMIIIGVILSSLYLYFQPPIYSANGSMEVITYDRSNIQTDDILQNTFYANKEVDKELEKLITYEVNKKVIDNMDLETQFFIKDGYRNIEIYKDKVPIKIKVKSVQDNFLGRKVKLIPYKDGYKLKIYYTIIEHISKNIFKKNIITIDNRLFPYNKPIKTKYFEITISKKRDLKKPIYFQLNGDSKDIYDNIVKNRLFVIQKNKNAPIIDISYEDNIPKRATEYINKLLLVFQNEGRIEKSKRNNQLSAFIAQQLSQNRKELKEAERALEKYKIKHRAIKTSTQADLLIRDLNNIDVAISENHLKEMIVDNVLNRLQNNDFKSIGSLLVQLNDKVNTQLIQSLQKLELEESRLSSEYTNEYPKLIVIRKQIDITKQKILKNIESLKLSIMDKNKNLERLKSIKERELQRLPVDEINIVNLNRKYQLKLEMNSYLLKKQQENDTIKSAIISDYKIVERAYPPKKPIKPKRTLIHVLAISTAILIGIILSLLHNSLSGKIKNIDDIEKITTIPIYGLIPTFRKKRKPIIKVFQEPQSIVANSFRDLRTNLQFTLNRNSSNIILITSILPKQGKSVIVSNLGAIFQLAGYKSIVIDLNLKNPSLNRFFNIDGSHEGMSSYLRGDSNMSDIIFKTAYPNLDIITAGKIATNPSELIISHRLEIMLNKLKEVYDYIIIDSTDLSSSKDTLHLMRYSSINLIVLKINSLKKKYIRGLEKIINRYKLKNIGFIINFTKKRVDNYI